MGGILESDSDRKDADVMAPSSEGAGDTVREPADASAKARPRRKRAAPSSASASSASVSSGSGGAILAGSDADGATEATGATASTESLIVTPGAARRERPAARSEPVDDPPRVIGLQPKPAAHGPAGQHRTGRDASARYGEAWPYYDLAVYDPRRDRARKLAIATAILGMGGLVLAAWLNDDPRPPLGDTRVPVVASAKQTPVFPFGAEELPSAGSDPTSDPAGGLTPEELAIMKGDTVAASSSLGQWFGPGGATADAVASQQGADPIATAPESPPAADPGPAEALAMATRQALAESQSRTAAAAAPAGPSAASAPARAPDAPARTAGSPTAAAAEAPAPTAPTVTRTNVHAIAASPAGRPITTPAKWISGGPTDADNRRGRLRGSVVVQFTVLPEGRASGCTAARPSGNAQLDALTCRIVTERARFTPARDALGRPLASQAHATYVWGRGRRQPN